MAAFIIGMLVMGLIWFAWYGLEYQEKEMEEAKRNGTNSNV